MLAAQRTARDGAEHPERRRRFDRRRRGDPARLFQHRLLRRAVLAQPFARPARGRPGAAQLRPDAVRYRPVPARLRELPRDRGSPRRSGRFLPDRPPGRSRPRPAAITPDALDAQLDQEFGEGSVALGAQVFGRTCAGCHSSQADPSESTTSASPTRAIRRCGSISSAMKGRSSRAASAPTRDARCTPTTWRAAYGINTPRANCSNARPIPPSWK